MMAKSSLMPEVIIIFAVLSQQLSDRFYCITNIVGVLTNRMLDQDNWFLTTPPGVSLSLFPPWLLLTPSVFKLLLFAPPLGLLHQNLVLKRMEDIEKAWTFRNRKIWKWLEYIEECVQCI